MAQPAPKMKKIFFIRSVRLKLSEIECKESKKDEKTKDKVVEYPKGEILTLLENHANENIGSGKALEYSQEAFEEFQKEEKRKEQEKTKEEKKK